MMSLESIIERILFCLLDVNEVMKSLSIEKLLFRYYLRAEYSSPDRRHLLPATRRLSAMVGIFWRRPPKMYSAIALSLHIIKQKRGEKGNIFGIINGKLNKSLCAEPY